MFASMIPFPGNTIHPACAQQARRATSASDEEIAFLRALLANPDDDPTRLVYADWLEEHDAPDRAEFIRLRYALEDPIRLNEHRALFERRQALRSGIDIRWQVLIGEPLVGQAVPAVVTRLTDRLVYADLGGLEGTIDCLECFWHGRSFTSPAELYTVGQRIEVWVRAMNFREGRIMLSPVHRAPVWLDAHTKYPVGSRHTGEVVNVMSYGVFVVLEPGIEGLLHLKEMEKKQPLGHPSERYEIGDSVEVTVLSLDRMKEEMMLGAV
jgi:uncharacterized protein (TIGR02996 family)